MRCSAHIIEGSGEAAVHDETCRTGAIRIEHLHAVAQGARRHGGHPAQLAASKNSNGCAGNNGAHEGSSMLRTSCCLRARQARIRSRRPESFRAQIEAASKAALAAPGCPMAKVPTGTPFGICTMDSKESTPFSIVAGTGTPKTGRMVLEATMPGRCAAPPAAAMIT